MNNVHYTYRYIIVHNTTKSMTIYHDTHLYGRHKGGEGRYDPPLLKVGGGYYI